MATVRERGQLLLVGGLALAVVLVALALVMNSAIYTENLASRDDAGRIDEVGTVNSDVRRATAQLMRQERSDNAEPYTTKDADVTDGLKSVGESVRYYGAQDGASVDVSYVSHDRGAVVQQTTQRAFTDDGGAESWTLAAGVNYREFTMTVDGNTLFSDPTDILTDDVFTVVVGSKEVYLYRDGGDFAVEVAGETPCLVPGGATEDVRVSLTDATVGGAQCDGLRTLPESTSGTTISFGHGESADGTYSLVVDQESSSLNGTGHYDTDDTAPTGPHVTKAVYSTSVRLTVDTPELHYETTIRVAPGENDG
ncbi:DUF7261 family protein [Halomarina oriensis]|uniref:Uncharacterized protein n=1 Tax=Halomarina oriensis TaxID=671145 RepID=A0A6B0GEX0_9EURY|nr:hypothetical protein [Halomarina oriensis]MWG33362.1 hypothetical protein [Halomarina oriensis]